MEQEDKIIKETVLIKTGRIDLEGNLVIPENSRGIILFAHGSGSSRLSPRNRYVADIMNKGKFTTLLFDLLTLEEEATDELTGLFRFDIELLSNRLISATEWIRKYDKTKKLKIGYFGASTGAGASLIAASKLPDIICAIVSRGGRPDLANARFNYVMAPTLLIVGGEDPTVIKMNKDAMNKLNVIKKLIIIPGAGHLFEEPGALQKVAKFAKDWFMEYIK